MTGTETATARSVASVFAVLMLGCSDGIAPTRPSPAPPPPPSPLVATKHTLSGVVFEATAHGNQPRAGIFVSCEMCAPREGGWTEMFTDAGGVYFFPGARNGETYQLWVVPLEKYRVVNASAEYPAQNAAVVEVLIKGDTRKDIQIARR